jgi:hypothetical protein
MKPFFVSSFAYFLTYRQSIRILMDSIEFDAPFGDKTRHVKLSPNVTGGGGY